MSEMQSSEHVDWPSGLYERVVDRELRAALHSFEDRAVIQAVDSADLPYVLAEHVHTRVLDALLQLHGDNRLLLTDQVLELLDDSIRADLCSQERSDEIPRIVHLDLPRDWLQVAPNAAEFKRLFRIWRKRYAHRWGGLRGFWKLEFQRGSKTREPAPHLHIFTAVPVGSTLKDFRNWVGASWAEVVNHPDPLQREHHRLAGTQVDIPKSNLAPREATAYFLKRSATHSAGPVEGVKEYQHQVPPSWEVAGGSGRFWGDRGTPPPTRRAADQQGVCNRARPDAAQNCTLGEADSPRVSSSTAA